MRLRLSEIKRMYYCLDCNRLTLAHAIHISRDHRLKAIRLDKLSLLIRNNEDIWDEIMKEIIFVDDLARFNS